MNPKLRMGLMLTGLLVAGWLAIFGDKTPVDAPVAARVPDRGTSGAVPPRVDPPATIDESDAGPLRRLQSRTGWFELASAGNDIFAAPVAKALPHIQEAPPPPPPEPPFRLIGRLLEDGGWSYFVERDNAVHVLRTGDDAAGFRLDSANDHELRLTRLADKTGFVIAIDSDKH